MQANCQVNNKVLIGRWIPEFNSQLRQTYLMWFFNYAVLFTIPDSQVWMLWLTALCS